MISQTDQWLGVELRHFAALQAVAAERSFRRAAQQLGYTQSAVSQQIATLERIVGERLIDRPGGPRPVSLTEAGQLLVRHADVIVARMHAAQADLAALAEGTGGSLRIGTYQSVGRQVLPGLMGQFASAWPGVRISLRESAHDDDLLALIEHGELDLTFAIFPLLPGPFEAIELMPDPYVLLVRADAPLARGRQPLHLQELAGLRLIGFRQCRSMEQIEVHLRAAGIEPEFVFRSDDNGTVQAMVTAGLGAALVPRLTVEWSDRAVVALELGEEVTPRRIALVWHRDRYRSPAARAFVEAAVAACRDLQQEIECRAAPV